MARRIAELATGNEEGSAASGVELGAGLGALTRPLLERAGRVIAVERDRELVPALRAELAEEEASGRLSVLEADAKALDLAGQFAGLPRPHVLCGNLPYQITGPLLELTTRAAPLLDRAVFLIQLEVAARLVARPGSKEYGALSVFVQAAFEVTRPLVVRSGAFYPPPKVDSAVVVLTPLAQPKEESPAFRALVRAAFEQRRKKLANAWHGVLGADADALARAAELAGVELGDRGERLGVAEFSRMADALARIVGAG